MPYWYLWLAVAVLSVFLSAIFSGVETGVYCLSSIRLRLRAEQADAAARRLQVLLRDRTHLLAVLLIGNNVANYATTLAATVLLVAWTASEQSAEFIAIVAVTPVLFVFGEMVPKTLFQKFADRLVYRWVGLVSIADRLLTYTGLAPLVWLLAEGVLRLLRRGPHTASLLGTREQVRGMLMENAMLGTISAHQTQIADNVLRVTETRVADVMTPLAGIRQLPATAPYDVFLALARGSPYSRLLVHRPEDRRQTQGVLGVVDALLAGREGWQPHLLMTQPATFAPHTPLMEALIRMRRDRLAVAVVVDAAGRTLGLVTLKDLVEEIVGELKVW